MKKGFTLVELSIVLVIVGLLIGGILVGQSLIESAKIKRLVRDLQQYEIATTQFYRKFRQLPGDSTFFTPAGNLNNELDFADSTCNGIYSAADGIQFWTHLSQAQMLSKTYRAWSPETCGGTDNDDYRHSSLKNIIAPFLALDPSAFGYNDYPIRVVKETNSNLQLVIDVPAKQVLGLESKMDSEQILGPSRKLGLSNFYGAGFCINDSGILLCSDPTALIGQLSYHFDPN